MFAVFFVKFIDTHVPFMSDSLASFSLLHRSWLTGHLFSAWTGWILQHWTFLHSSLFLVFYTVIGHKIVKSTFSKTKAISRVILSCSLSLRLWWVILPLSRKTTSPTNNGSKKMKNFFNFVLNTNHHYGLVCSLQTTSTPTTKPKPWKWDKGFMMKIRHLM